MNEIRVGDRWIGKGHAPFVVAEVGINHNGDLDLALEMVRVAKDSGADAVKFGMYKAEEFISDPSLTYTYTSQGRTVTEPMLDMFKRCELSREEWVRVRDFSEETGITFFSTAQNESDLDVLMTLGVPLVKVGSDDLTNLPMLKAFAKKGLPVVFSCGMATLAEAHMALDALGAFDGYPAVLLHCTSEYPAPPESVNLLKMLTLSKAFPTIPVGYSDHTEGILAASLATAFGACYLEKHFTMDHNLPGPDHIFSSNPSELKQWVEAIRTSSAMLGSPIVRPTPKEEEMRAIARRSIVSLDRIAAGEELTLGNIGLRRPGNGLPPAMLEVLLGKRAVKDIPAGKTMELGDFM